MKPVSSGPPSPPHADASPTTGKSKTRAQVRAELAAAKAAGLVTYGEQEYPVTPPSSAQEKTREQVRAELAAAKAAGLVTYGEQEYPATHPSAVPGKTREQVRVELAAAKAAGQVTYGELDYPPTPQPSPAIDPRYHSHSETLLDKLRRSLRALFRP